MEGERAEVAARAARRGAAAARAGLGAARTVAHAHALAAAAGARLDHHRVADFARDAHGLFGVGNVREVAGNGVDARRHGQLLRVDLVAQLLHGAGLGSNEDDFARLERRHKRRVFAQEAVARVHGLRARRLHGRQHARNGQVRLGRLGRPQQHRLVRRAHVNARHVRLAVHGHRLDACAGKQVAARAREQSGRGKTTRGAAARARIRRGRRRTHRAGAPCGLRGTKFRRGWR